MVTLIVNLVVKTDPTLKHILPMIIKSNVQNKHHLVAYSPSVDQERRIEKKNKERKNKDKKIRDVSI